MDERLKEALDEVGKLAKGGDLRDVKSMVKSFDEVIARLMSAEAAGDNDAAEAARASARALSKDAFALEKKYIPLLPHNKSISEKMRCRNIIMTVGNQKEPIILSILCMKPQKVILMHTEGSRGTARDVEDDPDIQSMNLEVTPLLITEYDASQNYGIIREQALTRVSTAENTVIDPTAGRKLMVASLALIAFYWRVPMVYVHNVEYKGVIFPFTERLRVIENPFDYFGDTELSLIQEQFNCHLYEAAFSTCEELKKKVRDAATWSMVDHLQRIIGVYLDWDSFLHSIVPKDKRLSPLLSERFRSIIEECCRMPGLEKCLPENVDANLGFLRKLDKTWRDNKNIVDEFRLVDIFASALRRAKQKKYDDAVARLYRCLEMCATMNLMQLSLEDTQKPDYEAFCSRIGMTREQLEAEYRKIQRRELSRERIGLDDQMGLLAVAGQDVANVYRGMRKQKKGRESLTELRNRSILAHGTNPIREGDWPDFEDKAKVTKVWTIWLIK